MATYRNGANKGQTFVVDIKCRQNHTWQGTVKWVEQQKALPFRSALELIKLMDSAMEISDEADETEETQDWQKNSELI